MYWQKPLHKWASGQHLMLGKVEVAFYYWAGPMHGNPDAGKWGVGYKLPGITKANHRFHTVEEAKEAAEKEVKKWLKLANLTN